MSNLDKHVAIDLDDVVLDFVGGLRRAIKKEYGVELRDEDVKDFNLRPLLDPIIGRSWWAWLRERDWLWENFEAVDGAMGAIERLRLDGYYLELLTSKPKWAEYSVWRWLGKWRPPFQRVTIVGQGDEKADFSDAPILVDDKVENLVGFYEAGRTGLLFSRPHNRAADLSLLGIERVNSWAEALTEIRRLTDG